MSSAQLLSEIRTAISNQSQLPVKIWTVGGGVKLWSEEESATEMLKKLEALELDEPRGGWIPAHALIQILDNFEASLQDDLPDHYPRIVLLSNREMPPHSAALQDLHRRILKDGATLDILILGGVLELIGDDLAEIGDEMVRSLWFHNNFLVRALADSLVSGAGDRSGFQFRGAAPLAQEIVNGFSPVDARPEQIHHLRE